MDTNGNQRKRGSRLNKNVSANEPISPRNENEVADVSAVAISPTLEEVVGSSPSVPAASECRRSSRKKIIKFDVRDLLNKNRKTHKIQIEARIDAPSTSKATTAKGSEVANSAAASSVRQDMLSKQKTFLEKSAIFRRYSISQEHKPPPLPLPMPPLLGKSNDNKEAGLSATSSTRRLSRTQEFFSNAMIKPKQTTSLIVAQIESNTPSSTTTTTKRRSVNKSVETEAKGANNWPTEVPPQVVQQRKRGRPARIKIPTPVNPSTLTSKECTAATSRKLTPEKAKNWKEYKACLAQQHSQTTETALTQDTINLKSVGSTLPAEDKIVEHITADDTIVVVSKPNKISVQENVEDANQQSEHEMILDIPKTADNVEVKELVLTSKSITEGNLKKDQLQIEIDSKSQSKGQNQEEALNANKTSQEVQEDANLLVKIVQDDQKSETKTHDHIESNTEMVSFTNTSSPETKEIEKLTSCSKQTIHNTRHRLKNKGAEILTVDDKEKLPETQTELEKPEEFIELSPEIIAEIMEESVQSIIEIDSHSSLENNEKALQPTETLQASSPKESLTATDTTLTQPSTPTKETIATYSRTSSSSESENVSEHSSYSSAPSSASSSTPSSRSYKSNSKLRVTIKRLSLPKSPSTSSQTSTSEELNPNVLRKKPPVAKRSKRLQKKFFEKLDDQSSFESVENTASISSVSMDNKFEIERPHDAGNTSQFLEKGEQILNISAPMPKEASVIENVSTRKSLRIRKDNISESSDEYQCRETGIGKQLSVQEPIGKDTQHELQVECSEKDKEIENITAEQHSENKPNETEIQAATKEQQGEIQQQTSDQSSTVDAEKQENVSDLVEHVVQEEHVPTEYNKEVVVQEDLEKANSNVDSKDIFTTVAAELTVNTAEEEVGTKIVNISCDATTDSLKLPEIIAELHTVIQAESSNTSESSISNTLDVHTTESNNKKSISEKETVSSPKRKSLRQQKDKNTAEASTASETDTPNDSPTTKERISACILEDKPELKNEQSAKDTAKVLPKRKARKNRFKNLLTSEIESETDSSGTGKQTPIEENNTLMPTKLKEIEENIATTETQSDEIEQEVNPVIEEVIIEEIEPQIVFESDEKTLEDVMPSSSEAIEVENVTEEYAASSNLLSSHIQNVSIETNTLLDILRTVQSNTEAALKASKSTKDTTSPLIWNEETTNVSSETIQQDKVLRTSNEDDSVSKGSSPTREVESPLTQMSPTRSQTFSPVTHKQTKGTGQSNTEKATEDPILVKESTNESEKAIQDQEKPSATSKEDERASKTSSPTRCEVESLHDVKISTSRSQTASPSVVKKSKRSVQSNTEAALKASKSTKDSSPTLVKEIINEGEAIIEEQEKSLSASKKNDRTSDVISPTRCEADSPLTLKALQKSPSRSRTSSPLITQKKSKRSAQSKTDAALVNELADNTEQKTEILQQDKLLITSKLLESEPKTHSPTRSKFESPLILKSIPISPSRSQTSSPLTHKKSKRTGQASTDAVLEANKSTEDSTATLVNRSAGQIKETIQQAEDLSTSKEYEAITKTNSPKRWETESPLTLKGIQTSPSRSKTASPSTSKKSKCSQQSNAERSKDSTPTSVNESVDNTDQIKETIQQAEAVSTSKEDETVTKSNSPTHCEAESPLTLKGIQISPTRSQSASPLTYLKSKCSPTRSNSSSPLTLKKVTRRYERRSRRGDESTHKTLEETFAEIAAQSSQAVLAAKEIDIAEDEAADNKTLLNEAQAMVTTLEAFSETPPIAEETTVEELEAEATDIMENLLDAIPVEGVIDDTTNLECEQTSQEYNINETKKLENILEEQEISKTTPARRGRKQKNRTSDVPTPVTKDIKETGDEHNLPEKENDDDKVKESTLASDAPPPPVDDLETNKVTKIESKESNTDLEQQTTAAEIANDNKVCKNSNTKRNTTKEPQEADVEIPESAADDSCKGNDEDDVVRTPKQLTKKGDSSQTKTEIKCSSKAKLTKKGKNNEEEQQSVVEKDDINPIPVPTTPPASKRGRKPKNQQETPPSSSSSKRKSKKDIAMDNNKEEDINEVNTKMVESENESKADALDKTLDDKLAKKKRQKKLKEAFEAALADDLAKIKDATAYMDSKSDTSSLYGLNSLDQAPSTVTSPTNIKDLTNESTKITCITPVEAEEDPDPLKDIEKFIADGVNLLKKDYKLDEDSVDDVLTATTKTTADNINEMPKETTKTTDVDIKAIVNTFETPADTPINTPSVTPPPKSPTSQLESSITDENSGVRRSHRIKLITKTPKALVGRGLVRDKERFSIKDDVETKIHYTLDDHLTGLAEVEAKNAKFLKDMEERLSNFQVIKENEYRCERVVSREAKKMICDCFLTHEEEERGELGCGEDCLNRLLMIECGPDCNVKERCTNKRFQKLLCSPCRVFRTEKKGFGIMADIEILPGEFIMEYVGEVIDTEEFEKRRIMYSQDKNRHYYFMALRSDAIIDATIKGNISRFINHSCDPNAETQKWTVNGELRIGFFSRKSIMPGEEITFNYQYQRYGREAQRCYCESANCRGWIGQEPASDEGEQIDDEDDESEDDDEEEEADTSNLLVHDDDEDSDASVADPEEVQKQLEMAAAQAEVELAPLKLLVDKDKKQERPTEEKVTNETNKTENEEDSKSKFKKLLSKMAEKVAAKHKQNKREQKMQRKKKSKESSADLANKLKFSEDPDIEDEVEFLKECGLKNQSDTLRLSRLMVRAKLIETRLNLLEILRKGDLPCRRLFLDYHGLRLLHGWMSEDAGNMQIRLALLQTLETLPIANKTVLTDSKVMQAVRNWCGSHTTLSPNEDSSSSNSNSQDQPTPAATVLEEGSDLQELQKLALKLVTTWEGLPEIFRIPKKERIEQMKEHEREADRQYAANAETSETTTDNDRYRRDRFGRVGGGGGGGGGLNSFNNTSNRFVKPNNGNPLRTTSTTLENIKNLSKAQRREMFAAKVARDEAEKRLNEERREFETKCRFFGLDPKKTRPQDVPFCVNPATGQWFSIERKPITTPPSYAHVQVPVKPKSTDPKDYQLPAVCATLPTQWKYAITPQGKIYYYHIKYRVPQWEPPTAAQLKQCENEDDDSESEYTNTTGEESTDDEDDILIGMDATQLKAYIDRKVEARRQKRYQRLVDERAISPRREEDRIYNQIEVRKYKENKEKIRKRKEEIRRKRAEALRQSSLNMCTLGSLTETSATANVNKLQTESDEELGALPIQDYLISSDEENDIKAEVNSPLIDRIVEGDKIVDELDALTTKKQLKRPLPPHRDLSEPSTSVAPGLNPVIARQEYKKRKLEKKEKRKPKEQDAKYRKNKEKFRCEIAGIIVHHLKPYRKDTCTVGRIQSNEDFNHLARKLTHFVMIKELKYCESVGQTLVVTESVKSKSREFIKKYMAKYGDVYVKPTNDPEFKDIPFTL